jgi:hypothetical protein
MNRRSFFRFLGAGAATLALSEAIPFGRVWSFPSKIVVPEQLSTIYFFAQPLRIGSTIRIRFPQRWIVRDGLSYAPQGIATHDEIFTVTSLSPPQFDPALPHTGEFNLALPA